MTCPDVYINAHTSSSSRAELLEELEQLLMGIALMKELTLRTKDYLVSFGERLSTRLFAAYLNSIDGTFARQVRNSVSRPRLILIGQCYFSCSSYKFYLPLNL